MNVCKHVSMYVCIIHRSSMIGMNMYTIYSIPSYVTYPIIYIQLHIIYTDVWRCRWRSMSILIVYVKHEGILETVYVYLKPSNISSSSSSGIVIALARHVCVWVGGAWGEDIFRRHYTRLRKYKCMCVCLARAHA